MCLDETIEQETSCHPTFQNDAPISVGREGISYKGHIFLWQDVAFIADGVKYSTFEEVKKAKEAGIIHDDSKLSIEVVDRMEVQSQLMEEAKDNPALTLINLEKFNDYRSEKKSNRNNTASSRNRVVPKSIRKAKEKQRRKNRKR